jgi:hypothetical protein
MFKAVCVDPKQRILVVIKPYFLARQETLEEIYHAKQEVEYYNYIVQTHPGHKNTKNDLR